MTQAEAEVRALAAERDELEIENRALREKLRSLSARLEQASDENARLRREVFGPRAAEAAL